jgi:hypothetical protein
MLCPIDLLDRCSVVVGMHPDEATDLIIDYAVANKKPFVVLPCCVCEDKFPERRLKSGGRVQTFDHFVEYLMEKHPGNEMARMRYAGPNLVIFNRMGITSSSK